MTAGPEADVSVRVAWAADAPSIVAIQHEAWTAAWPGAVGVPGVDALVDQWARIIEGPPDARIRVLVALERATVRGVALVHPCHDPDTDQLADAEIGEFLVAPAHRGAGHGSRLLQACVDTLRADHFSRAVWWVGATDDATRAFAVSAGWGPDGGHRELAEESGTTVKQVRLHTAL